MRTFQPHRRHRWEMSSHRSEPVGWVLDGLPSLLPAKSALIELHRPALNESSVERCVNVAEDLSPLQAYCTTGRTKMHMPCMCEEMNARLSNNGWAEQRYYLTCTNLRSGYLK